MLHEMNQVQTIPHGPGDFSKYLEEFNVGIVPELELARELGGYASEYCPLFYRGNLDILFSLPRVAVVGTRKPSELGIARTRKLVRELSALNVVIVSGLAKGVDAVAHSSALELYAKTIAVLGTPVHRPYPAENKELYSRILERGLVLSPSKPHEQTGKYLFPRRNRLMALLCDATIIVEAGATSGVIHQAAECLRQKKRLFILKSLAENSAIGWVSDFLKSGAEVLEHPSQLVELSK